MSHEEAISNLRYIGVVLLAALLTLGGAALASWVAVSGMRWAEGRVITCASANEIQATLDQTVDFLSDLHAERAKP